MRQFIKHKKIFFFYSAFFTIILLFAPVIVGAVPSCKGLVCECTSGKPGECTFDEVVYTVQFVMNKLSIMAMSFIVVIIAFAGFKYIVAGDNAGERKKANGMFVKAGIGICFILGAWLIVNLIAKSLGVTAFQFTM